MLYIVMYHYIRDLKHSRYPKIKGLDINLFRHQIDFFKSAFSVVTMEEVIAASKGEIVLPDRALLLTFDDGYIDNYTFAFPVLRENGIQGSFFIPGKTFATRQLLDVNKIHYILASTDIGKLLPDIFERMDIYREKFDYPSNKELFGKYATENRFDTKEIVFVKNILQTILPEQVRNCITSDLFEKYVGATEEQIAYELYMTEEQIATMKYNGMFIGIHGYDHYWLSRLPEQQMRSDIDKALDVMMKGNFIDSKEWVMNYPYGDYNQNVLEYAKSRGACVGLTTEVRIADLEKDNILRLPRLDCNDFPPKSEHYKNI